MDSISFDFDGIVHIIEHLKLSSSGPDNINAKIPKDTKAYSAIIITIKI